MKPPAASMNSPRFWERAATPAAAALIAVAALAAYANTFGVPFVFDDPPSILENPGVRHLWPPWAAFRPLAPASTVDGRPFANFTLAVNFAISGTGVWSYHALNLLIHLCAGWTLFGIVRRTLVLAWGKGPSSHRSQVTGHTSATGGDNDFGPSTLDLRPRPLPLGAYRLPLGVGEADALAFAIALLWTLHPLQTEAVTYVVQRVESLMGLFFLLTLYCFIRATTGGESSETNHKGTKTLSNEPSRNSFVSLRLGCSNGWFALSVFTCLLGMATKEVMVTAPVLVFLYDRTFVAGTFREAWRRRWRYHLGLASTWLLLAALVAGTGWDRGGAAGFDVGVKPWHYWLTQPGAILHYLRLSVWPHPLVFDYGSFFQRSLAPVWWQALLLCLILLFSLAAIYWKPAAGFLTAWFFGILAVTSVVPGTIQMIVEHRLYLPLAAVITALVLAAYALFRRLFLPHSLTLPFSYSLVLLPALALGLLTHHRNADYASELALWTDTVAKRPDSPRAHNALAFALDHAGRTAEAIAEFNTALRLAPDNADLHDNLGVTLAGAGRTAEAIAQFETALRLRPEFPTALCNLGNALVQAGKPGEAVPQYEHALRLKPGYADAEYNLAGALDLSGQPAAALTHLEAAIRLKPEFASAHFNLGELLDRLGRTVDATREFEEALRLDPALAQAHADLGVLLCRSGRTDAGLAHLREAVRLQPGNVPTRFNLGVALLHAGRAPEAATEFEAVLRLRPDYAPARRALEQARARGPGGF